MTATMAAEWRGRAQASCAALQATGKDKDKDKDTGRRRALASPHVSGSCWKRP